MGHERVTEVKPLHGIFFPEICVSMYIKTKWGQVKDVYAPLGQLQFNNPGKLDPENPLD